MTAMPHLRLGFSGSYAPEDVCFLLKPLPAAFVDVGEKERRIQSGQAHYSEMLSAERAPGPAYVALYEAALARHGPRLARHVNQLAAAMIDHWQGAGASDRVIVSLLRAGTPIGVLLARRLRRLGHKVAHYSISIIRDRGIDRNALATIVARHGARGLVFVDGWTGKGSIAGELRGPRGPTAMGVAPVLAVIADPAGRADLAATAEDYVIPSGILNGTISGLVSRSVLNAAIGPDDYHGCVLLDHLAPHDRSRSFVDHVAALADALPDERPHDGMAAWAASQRPELARACDALIHAIMHEHGVGDRNRIKPGIAEATRALLRRVPDRLLLRDSDDPDVAHLLQLAQGQGVPIGPLPKDCPFRAATIIASLGGD
jgi:hypothetical protein